MVATTWVEENLSEASAWVEQDPTQSDYDTISTDTLLELADDDWEAILFHTWNFYYADTEWIEDDTF